VGSFELKTHPTPLQGADRLDILQARLEGKKITSFMNIFQRLESEYEGAK